ncbi:tetraacyldisaccharide 4'-kinase [Pedobacter deserti]|uniref:tetraacyldisaccharide 4'-kinase n=1 Tax=Pedobacter deserti TaxID=2817382 RepID=UPI00210A8C42|nr:tetraacyldisaccharide 4'-kinase [Pedobacter sp. SYSU D00382]
MTNSLRLLLLPFSLIYGLVVIVRNWLFDVQLCKSARFPIPVICVGNLVVGGSGKTPVTEYLVQLLSSYRIAILSRGYGRETKGFLIADDSASAKTIGDEPMQFYQKFPQVTVAVCEDRAEGIKRLQREHDLIILDDAFQHRWVKAGLNILLFEYQRLLHQQFLLPAGNMREPFNGYHRADIILVTKAPEQLNSQSLMRCKQKFRLKSSQQLAFSYLTYADLVHVFTGQCVVTGQLPENTHIFLLTGIANPTPLMNYLQSFSFRLSHYDYPDHYAFKQKDIDALLTDYRSSESEHKMIITTEKDAKRLIDPELKPLFLDAAIFYLPVEITLQVKDKPNFDQKILDYVAGTTRNRSLYKEENKQF